MNISVGEYDITSNYHGGEPYSDAAFNNTPRSCRERQRDVVLRCILRSGRQGQTCDEVEMIHNMRHQTCSARFTELKAEGWIVPTGDKRRTRSRRFAGVYIHHTLSDPQLVLM